MQQNILFIEHAPLIPVQPQDKVTGLYTLRRWVCTVRDMDEYPVVNYFFTSSKTLISLSNHQKSLLDEMDLE
jgi:hypothetical protein